MNHGLKINLIWIVLFHHIITQLQSSTHVKYSDYQILQIISHHLKEKVIIFICLIFIFISHHMLTPRCSPFNFQCTPLVDVYSECNDLWDWNPETETQPGGLKPNPGTETQPGDWNPTRGLKLNPGTETQPRDWKPQPGDWNPTRGLKPNAGTETQPGGLKPGDESWESA